MLIRRQAFYDAGGFDEEYELYAEDDQLSMDVRRSGWKILFVPHATAVHEEGQSSRFLPDRLSMMNRSNALFGAKNRELPGLQLEPRSPGELRLLKA